MFLETHRGVSFNRGYVYAALREDGVYFEGANPLETVLTRLEALKERGLVHQPIRGQWQWGSGRTP